MIDFEMLDKNIEKFSRSYSSARPFEYVVIDRFLTVEGLEAIGSNELMRSKATQNLSSDLVFAQAKFESPVIETINPGLRALRSDLLCDRFRKFLCSIVGRRVFVDASFTGGGLHQGGSGSYLDMHTDFNRHPTNLNWVRELNLLLYLNAGWRPEYGGCLDLENMDTGERQSIEPLENRMVIMLTKGHTLHGYKKIKFPDGIMRTSVAAYAYSIDDGCSRDPYTSTKWYPKSFSRRLISLVTNKLVPIKQRLFGSRTADRARRE